MRNRKAKTGANCKFLGEKRYISPICCIPGCLALLLALPIAAFPRELPGHKAIQAQRVQETKAKDEKEVENIKSIKDLPRLTNKETDDFCA